MSVWRTDITRADKRAYHRLTTGITYHARRGVKRFRFLTLTGISSNYRRTFDALRRMIRKNYGRFEYFAVRTNEGKTGVLHILFVGSFLPQQELKEKWQQISGAWVLGIQKVSDFKWQGFEMTRQQMTAQYSQSRRWLPDGIAQLWKEFKHQFKGTQHTSPAKPYDFDKWHDLVWNIRESKQIKIT